MAQMSLSLPESTCDWLAAQVAQGSYLDMSAYVADLILREQKEVEAIKCALIVGEESGVSSRNVADIVAEQKQKLLHG